MWRVGKYKCCYQKNCDGQRIRVLLSQELWRTKVAISTSMTDWLLLSLLLGRKSCINVAIVTQWRTRVDVCVTDKKRKHFIVPHNFFVTCYRHFIFSSSQFFRKRPRNAAIAASLNAPLWNWCNESTDVRHKFNVANLSWINLWFCTIKVHENLSHILSR